MTNLGVARPALLALLLLVPVLVAFIVRSVRAREVALRVFAGGSSLSARSRTRLWAKAALLLVAFVAVVVALAGPYVDLRTRGARRAGLDLVLAIDVSQSMATRDVQPDRLRAARRVAQEIGDQLIGSRLSLVLFAGQGTIRYPATTDPRIVGDVLDNSGKGVHLEQGTSLAAAIESAAGAFAADSTASRSRAIVVVSDGEVTLGASPDLPAIADRAIKLFTIGVGTTEGGQIPTYDAANGNFTGYLKGPGGVPVVSRLDETQLQQLADAGGGRYWRYTGDDAIVGELVSQLRALEATVPLDDGGSIPDERSQLFVAIAVAALLVERFLPDRRRMPSPRDPRHARPERRRRLLGLAIGSSMLWAVACGSSIASGLEDANARFGSGQYQQALADYRDLQRSSPDSPQLGVDTANVLYMLGDFVHALPEYAHAITAAPPDVRAIAQYDRGNTLFRMGRLADARDAYREALRLDPNDTDAKFNLELVERLLAGAPNAQNAQPSASGGPRSTPRSGDQGSGSSGANGSPQPGQGVGQPSSDQAPPTNDRTAGATPPDDLRSALKDFRQGLTLDDALRVLNALDQQDRGVTQLLEGPRSSGQEPDY